MPGLLHNGKAGWHTAQPSNIAHGAGVATRDTPDIAAGLARCGEAGESAWPTITP